VLSFQLAQSFAEVLKGFASAPRKSTTHKAQANLESKSVLKSAAADFISYDRKNAERLPFFVRLANLSRS
jgi:hypothetical protein